MWKLKKCISCHQQATSITFRRFRCQGHRKSMTLRTRSNSRGWNDTGQDLGQELGQSKQMDPTGSKKARKRGALGFTFLLRMRSCDCIKRAEALCIE
ncbi:hypothetical protein QQ045_027998 [Rhodiola kirilowii]